MDTAVWAALAIAGLVAGIGIGFWLGRLQNNGDRVAELETELEAYRAKVTEHFAQSATHFQAIGQQYKELYEHMAAGSEALCAPDAKATMSFPAPVEVTALAEPAAPVEPPVQPAAAATDVEDSEVIETTPYETDALSEGADTAGFAQNAEPEADSESLVAEQGADAEEALEERAAEADDAETPSDELAAGEESKGEASDEAGTLPSGDDAEPEKRLYH